MKIIFATKNIGKIKEVKEILKDTQFEIISMIEAKIVIEVIEDGETFEENAIKKAVEIMKITNCVTIADDSGLEIDFLDNKPGVHSARFLGEDTPYIIKNKKILELMQNVKWEKRTARFKSVIAVAFPDGEVITTTGTLEGFISNEVSGENGFGYDPIFYVTQYNETLGTLSGQVKNSISHRSIALNLMKEKLIKRK
jgi:XTP/dITP diphosphohydrolase